MIFKSIKYLCLRIVPSTTVFSGCLWTLTIYWFSQISTITERSFPYKQWNLHILKLNYFGSSNKSIQMQQKEVLINIKDSVVIPTKSKNTKVYLLQIFFPEPIFLVQIFFPNLLCTHHISGNFRHDPSFTYFDTLRVYITKYSICRSYIRYCLL